MSTLRDCTLVFLIRKDGAGRISHICLAMKKRGFGVGKWNGVGGKVERGEGIEDAARREAQEEIHVHLGALEKVGELTFMFTKDPNWNQLVHVYLCDEWQGEPQESEEMAPKWFASNDIPYEEMWEDDWHWLPYALAGERVKGEFRFDESNALLDKDVHTGVQWET